MTIRANHRSSKDFDRIRIREPASMKIFWVDLGFIAIAIKNVVLYETSLIRRLRTGLQRICSVLRSVTVLLRRREMTS
jgi:hypothetical protein